MITCPNCQSANRAGAKYCKSCAAPLPVSSAVTLKLNDMSTNPSKQKGSFSPVILSMYDCICF